METEIEPPRCDVCMRLFDAETPRRVVRYGPFELHVCPPCVGRLARQYAARFNDNNTRPVAIIEGKGAKE